jgi:SpoVK/Ycf46/Vps4 family AAA+-type ATPase
MWQGVTEGNLERILNLLKAMSPIAVIVDEADAQLGNRSNAGDSGVSSRVFAQIAQFMGNTESAARSSGSCSPAAPTCSPSTSNARAAPKSTSRSSTRTPTKIASPCCTSC